MSRERARRAAQLDFVARGAELEVGDPSACPIAVDELARVDGDEPFVVASLGGGLTARVFRLRAAGRDWTLKRARVPALVQNVDGQTSFLNEAQRRADFAAEKERPGGAERFSAIVDTRYASFRRGVLLSPWIEGVTVADWDERRLTQLFAALVELLAAGYFEWDLCPGNILDDGQRLWLFDFGYMYRFDPRTELNSNGLETPLFHGAERFETRNFSAHLLRLEARAGADAALAAFRMEKSIAVDAYAHLVERLRARHATPAVLGYFEALLARWTAALAGDLAPLYFAESWRSHRLDVDDDLRGQTCTPFTRTRLGWLRDAARDRHADLVALDAFFGEDAHQTQAELLDALARADEDAARWQIHT
ncbi:hypothetical protein L6R52_34545 [Myxococcota bacterium]|nr:hypothetical protein [Myxococcota bacterium]